jgi:hypothetical protein
MKKIEDLVAKRNWDNDLVRILKSEAKEGPLLFSYDRTVNSLLEVCLELVIRVNELSDEVEKLTKKAEKKK